MVDKIQKALDKFSEKEKKIVKDLFQKIKIGKAIGLDIKKLKGYGNIFRIRKGKIRIIYRVENDQIFILAVERRNEGTYKGI